MAPGPAGGQWSDRGELDLATDVAKTTFRVGATTFTREIFASAPDHVIVVRLSADAPGQVSCKARLPGVEDPA